MKYEVLEAYSLDNLVDKVRRFIDLGWIPQGGAIYVNHLSSPSSSKYIQTMINCEILGPR